MENPGLADHGRADPGLADPGLVDHGLADPGLLAFRPLRHRSFALLFAASLVSNVGTWMQTVAVAAMLAASTGTTIWPALVAAATFLPSGLLSPLGGALADRLDRRRFLIASNATEAGLAAALAVLAATGNTSPPLVTGVVLLAGCVTATSQPFAAAVLPDLVPAEDLLGAISLNSAQWNVGRVLGPALAAAVISVGSFSLAFAVNSASFLATIAALALICLPPRTPVASGRLWRAIADGARAARSEPACRAAIGLIALSALLVAPFIALIAAKAHLLAGGGLGRSRATARATGALVTAQGIGAVAGALSLAAIAHRVGRRRLVVGGLLATPAALCLYAWAPSLTWAFAALLLVGAGYIGILTGLSTVVQLRAPAAYRGRVLSLFFVALSVVYATAAPLQGAIADRIGLATTTTGTAVLMVVAVAGIALLRPGVLRSLDDPVPAGPVSPVSP
jgi:MFS family permease